MLGWIIFGGIVLLIVLLLWQSVKATLCYENGRVDLKVKFLFMTLFPLKPKKPEKNRKKKQKAERKARQTEPDKDTSTGSRAEETHSVEKTAQQSEVKQNDKKEKSASNPVKQGKSLDFDLEMIMDFVRSASPPVKRLFKKIRVRNLYIDYVVGTDDAAKTAIKYGTICAALYPLIEWLTTYFSVQAQEVNIEADFSREKDDAFAYCEVKLRVGTALGCALWLGVRVLKTYMKYNKNPQSKMPAKAQKKKG